VPPPQLLLQECVVLHIAPARLAVLADAGEILCYKNSMNAPASASRVSARPSASVLDAIGGAVPSTGTSPLAAPLRPVYWEQSVLRERIRKWRRPSSPLPAGENPHLAGIFTAPFPPAAGCPDQLEPLVRKVLATDPFNNELRSYMLTQGLAVFDRLVGGTLGAYLGLSVARKRFVPWAMARGGCQEWQEALLSSCQDLVWPGLLQDDAFAVFYLAESAGLREGFGINGFADTRVVLAAKRG